MDVAQDLIVPTCVIERQSLIVYIWLGIAERSK